MKKIRVLIADDHSVVRIGLSNMLTDEGSFEVIGTAQNGEEAVALARTLHPDVTVMDLVMPKKDGNEAIADIIATDPTAKIVVLTSFGSTDGIARALRAGAVGALMKSAENEEIFETIRRVAAGEQMISKDISRMLKDDPPLPALSPRQKEILESVIRGLTYGDIASQLGIGKTSVKTHIESIFAKIGAANRSEAVAIALKKHLLKI